MEVLGHSQVTLTLNTYSHVIPTLGREAADRMDDVLRLRPEPGASRRRLTSDPESNQAPPVALSVALLTETVPPFDGAIDPQNGDFELGGLVPATGLEPVTKGLRVPCSTN